MTTPTTKTLSGENLWTEVTQSPDEYNSIYLNRVKIYHYLHDKTPEIFIEESVRCRTVIPIRRMLELSRELNI
jgi:hypothetical protein